MSDFIFKIQPNIVLGSYATSRAGQFARRWGDKFMVVMDPTLKQSGTAAKITQSLTDRKVDFFTFEDIPAAADTQMVQNALTLAREAHVDGVIAAGGAKALNAARAVCTLYYESKDIYDFIDGASVESAPLPLIAIPTTFRDYFTFTGYTPVVDARSSRLRLLKTSGGLCKMAIFDSSLAATLPPDQKASMAIEVLSMATEAYISQRASFFSDMIAEKAIELLGYAIDGAPSLTITSPQSDLYSQAGCMASLAAASSALGAGCLISLCMTARFKVSSAHVATIMYPCIVQDAATFRKDRIARVARILRAAPHDAADDEAVAALIEYVRTHSTNAKLPQRLKDLNVPIERLSLAAEDAGDLELINTLPRSMNSDDLFSLMKQAF